MGQPDNLLIKSREPIVGSLFSYADSIRTDESSALGRNENLMTSAQHAAIWAAINAGHTQAAFVLPTHLLPAEQARQRENKFRRAANKAPRNNVVSKRTSKKPGANFSRGMYWNCSRAHAELAYRHTDNGKNLRRRR